jgi:hypothetical protein
MRNGKPLLIDGYCGLGGWTESFLSEGWECIGIDIERHDYGTGEYPSTLILQDMRTISGAQFKDADLLVFSPPCTEYSYMAMPWSRGRQIASALLGKGEFPEGYMGSITVTELNDLFNQCFRIQREVSEAAGHYVPMVVENVRGAQKWVGKARWNFGSFYLWGDVPALMPIPAKARFKSKISCAARRFDERIATTPEEAAALHYRLPEGVKVGISWSKSGPGNPGQSFQTAAILKSEGNKTVGMNWSDQSKRGQDFTRIAGQQAVKVASESGRRTDIGNGARFTSRDCGVEGSKGFKNFHDSPIAALGSKSSARKRASAEIAKIPPALASWIARIFKPEHSDSVSS